MIIKLDKKFYDLNAIKEALEDFKEVCEGKILNDTIEVQLNPKGDINNLDGEFCNYVLGLMKNNMLV